jgi:hypothetical protein
MEPSALIKLHLDPVYEELAALRAEFDRLRSLSERAGLADGVPAYAVAALPTSGVGPGSKAWASDGRKDGEGAGAGTGVEVVYDGSAWLRVSDFTAVQA